MAIQLAFAKISIMYIADGHHRSADALRKSSLPGCQSKFIMAAIFPDSQLRVLPYNRCITSLGTLKSYEFLHKIQMNFTISEIRGGMDPTPRGQHEICMYWNTTWYSLTPKDSVIAEFDDDPVSSLDPEILYQCLLKPILGIECQRSDQRLVYVCGSKGSAELERKVDDGEVQVSFFLQSVSVTEIMHVADCGRLLPPKVILALCYFAQGCYPMYIGYVFRSKTTAWLLSSYLLD
jgi:uncharacterized protein (DUF1015 family)